MVGVQTIDKMIPIAELISHHPKLAAKLRRFSFLEASKLVGGLGLLPELLENTIRVEILTHLVASCCQGKAIPQPKDLAEWIGTLMAESPAASMEDPAEDCFIGCVNSTRGSFRVFQGNFMDGAFHVERLLDFYLKKSEFPPFQEIIFQVIALLTLTDSLAGRAGLDRYTEGSGNAGLKISLPRWKYLEPRFRNNFFTDEDLDHLGIAKSTLVPFFLKEEDRAKLIQEKIWASSLERRPLLEADGGLLVIEPSTLCRTIVRFMLEALGKMGGIGESLYQVDNAAMFVNDVRSNLGIKSIEYTPPKPRKGTPNLFPAFGAFDLGKPVIMLTYTPPLEGAVIDFAGADSLTDDEESQLHLYIETCTKEIENDLQFSGGLIIVCIAGYGREGRFQIDKGDSKWHVYIATLRDWIALTNDGECTAMRLWKLGEHENKCKQLGIQIMNLAGLVNLFAAWKSAGYRLVPQSMDIRPERKMISMDCAFAHSIRVDQARHRDEHCIAAPEGDGYIRVRRLGVQAYFPKDRDASIYVAITEGQKLLGCTKNGLGIWWVVAPARPERSELWNLLKQLWNCVLNWTNCIMATSEREWPGIREHRVVINIQLPNFDYWNLQQNEIQQPNSEDVKTEVDVKKKSN
jgi:hypothetical protein